MAAFLARLTSLSPGPSLALFITFIISDSLHPITTLIIGLLISITLLLYSLSAAFNSVFLKVFMNVHDQCMHAAFDNAIPIAVCFYPCWSER